MPLRSRTESYCQNTIDRLVETFTRAGLGTRGERQMHRIFQEAGLPAPGMHQEARMDGGADSPIYGFIEQMVRSLLRAMEQTGVATTEDVGVDRVAARWSIEATHRGEILGIQPTGRSLHIGGLSIYRLAHGNIAEQWERGDALSLLQQLGYAQLRWRSPTGVTAVLCS